MTRKILFTTPDCGPCQSIKEEVPPGEFSYEVIDVTKGADLYNKLGFSSGVPRYVELKNGNVKEIARKPNVIVKKIKR